MHRDELLTAFKNSLHALSDGVRFLIPSEQKAIKFHEAVFANLSDAAAAELLRALTDCPGLVENILEALYWRIDFDGYRAIYGDTGIMHPISPFANICAKEIANEFAVLQKRYPLFIGATRPAYSEEDNEFMPSVETLVDTALTLSGSEAAHALYGCAEGLLSKSYTSFAQSQGYDDLADAERVLDAAAYDLEFTDSLCSGEG